MTALQTSNLGDGTQTTLVRIEDVCARSDLVRHLSHCNTGSKIGGWGAAFSAAYEGPSAAAVKVLFPNQTCELLATPGYGSNGKQT